MTGTVADAVPVTAEVSSAESLRAVLSRGVDEAIITRDQAQRLAALAKSPAGPSEDEHLRLVTGFADIFVTIGILLFAGSASFLIGNAFGQSWGYLAVSMIAWALAELFTRKRRMALPSIVLLVVFAYASFQAVAFGTAEAPLSLPENSGEAGTFLIASIVTLLLVTLHYWRFAVPITIAAGMAALVGAALSLSALAFGDTSHNFLGAILFAAGLAVFALAMRFDLSDQARVTRRSDIAFWLHLLAAPLIVHPMLMTYLGGSEGASGSDLVTSLSILGIVLALSLVALAIDRRAILVSSLAYAGYTLQDLFRQIGSETSSVALTLLALGAFVLLLSAGWRPLRRVVLRALPSSLRQRLPQPVGS